MTRKAGQGKEEEESRARQEEEKTPACHGRGHHVVEQVDVSVMDITCWSVSHLHKMGSQDTVKIVLIRVIVDVMKYYSQKQLGEEKLILAYTSILQFIISLSLKEVRQRKDQGELKSQSMGENEHSVLMKEQEKQNKEVFQDRVSLCSCVALEPVLDVIL
ncbi:hypothetical protein STEG23_014331 [Scotinomys teguina]